MSPLSPSCLLPLLLTLCLAQGCSLLIDGDQCAEDTECQKFATSGQSASCQEGRCEVSGMVLVPDMTSPTGRDMTMVDLGGATGDMAPGTRDMAPVDMLTGPKIQEVPASEITVDTTWRADTVYLLKGKVFVSAGVRLTVEAGTLIRGEEGSALIVRSGGTLSARGTATNPVVFTSSKPPGSRTPGDWGGSRCSAMPESTGILHHASKGCQRATT